MTTKEGELHRQLLRSMIGLENCKPIKDILASIEVKNAGNELERETIDELAKKAQESDENTLL